MGRGRTVGALLVALWVSLGAPLAAQGQRGALALIVESDDPAVRPEELRRTLAERTGWAVLDLSHAEGSEPQVIVALGPQGPATVVVRVADRPSHRFQIVRGPESGWILDGLAAVVAAVAPDRPAALRSWSGRPAPSRGRSLLRPWPEGLPTPSRGRYQIEREWIEASAEVGAALSAPAPTRAGS